MNATILETDLRDDLDELAEQFNIAIKRDEQRSHIARKEKRHEENAKEC